MIIITTTSASPSLSLSKVEGAVLYIFNDLHIYHIICISLLGIFEKFEYYQFLRKARAVLGWPFEPHLPSSSPKERRRCCITTPNFITTTSTLFLHSAFSESLKTIRNSEKQGLCVGGLLHWTPIAIGGDEAGAVH